MVLVRATDAIRLCRGGQYEILPPLQSDALLESLERRHMIDLRHFVARARLSSDPLSFLEDKEVLALLRRALKGHEVVGLRESDGAGADDAQASVVQRRLIREIDGKTRGKLSLAGRRYKLVSDVDLGKLPDRDSYEVVGHDEAARVLDGLAKENATAAELLASAKQGLTRDWRPPLTPDGLILLRKTVTMQAAAPNLAEAITPSQLKKMLAKTEWIEIVANDELGNPYTGPCRIQLPDGSIREGNFDEQGLWGDYDIDPGKCQLLLPDVPEAAAPGVMPAWIGLDLIDEQGAPVVGAAYQVTGSDSTVQSGVLDDDGKARVTGLVPGPCDISFPDFDSTEWIPNAKPPSTGQIHTVDDGEHVAAIAAQFGFRSFNTIWDHPKNAELKSRRKNPHVLQPGDEIFIPDHGKDTASGMTGAFHSYTLKGEALKLRLKLLSILGEPLTGATCTLTVNGVDSEITSNDKGIITAPLPPDTRSATLVAEKQTYTLVVGGLDPIDTPAGLHARLANLGYDLGAEEENDDDDDGAFDPERLQFALELFQSDQQLPITSQANEQTKQRIEQVAGS